MDFLQGKYDSDVEEHMGIVSKIYYKYERYQLKRRIASLVTNGAEIGEKIAWFSPDITIDSTRPYLLHIGDYCKVTKGVIILTHDYSLSVMRRVYGEWIGEGQETYIGDNCFIGMNSVILMGTHIGDNCIVGAGSVVHGNFPDNVVIAGNPAKVICTLEEHYKKRCERTIDEAKGCAQLIRKRLKREPTPKDLIGFRFLFTPRTNEALSEYGIDSFACNGDEPDEVKKAFFETTPHWESFEDFLKDI